MDARYISCTETAKLVRAALKENFPGIKFSVKSSSYAGGASIHVKWTDGPTTKAVDKIVKPFQGSTFDGMTDSKTYHSGMFNGEEVRFGADSVGTSRSHTRAFIEAIVAQYCKQWGLPLSKIKISGNEQIAYVDAWDLGHSESHWFNALLHGTDEKNMHRAYAGMEEAKQAEHDEYIRNEPQRRKEAQERAEREREEAVRSEQARAKREQVRQEQEQARASREMPINRTSLFYSRQEALQFLGAKANATDEEIRKAFIAKVKYYADGRGGYGTDSVKVDMDKLVKAKEKALQK